MFKNPVTGKDELHVGDMKLIAGMYEPDLVLMPPLPRATKELRFSGIQGNGVDFAIDDVQVNLNAGTVPEPASLSLLGPGLQRRRASAAGR